MENNQNTFVRSVGSSPTHKSHYEAKSSQRVSFRPQIMEIDCDYPAVIFASVLNCRQLGDQQY